MGNIALVDCHSMGKKTAENLYIMADSISKTIYFYAAQYIIEMADIVAETDFCQYGMTIEGIL